MLANEAHDGSLFIFCIIHSFSFENFQNIVRTKTFFFRNFCLSHDLRFSNGKPIQDDECDICVAAIMYGYFYSLRFNNLDNLVYS